MFTSINQFVGVWKHEMDATSRIFDNLTDESLSKPQVQDVRSLGRVAWHIVTTLPEMGTQFGLSMPEPNQNTPVPSNAETIKSSYRQAAAAVLDQVGKWSDADLLKEDNMYGQTWKRGASLMALMVHQVHHRGQMTVLMRLANLPVPGVYGPAKEEWAKMGMKPPEI